MAGFPRTRQDQIREAREHPEDYPAGIPWETLARDDWAMLRRWRDERDARAGTGAPDHGARAR